MTAPENIIGTRKEVERLDVWGTVLRNRIARDQHELRTVEKAKAGHERFLEELKATAQKAGRRRVTLDDIQHCDTQREVVRYVTEVGFGLAHLGEVAELVKGARMSKAEKDSIRSTLHHYVNDSEDFVHIGKSWVWRIDFGPAPTLEEVEAAETAEQAEEAEDDQGAEGEDDDADTASGGEPAPVSALFPETDVVSGVPCSTPAGR